jgi:hypothetical protein
MNKKCFKCGKVKPIDHFYKHPAMGDGHLGKCKGCTKKDVGERYNDPVARERIREYEHQRFHDPDRKKKTLEYQRRRRAKNRGKNAARAAISRDIRSGKIVPQPCEKCGNPKTEAHHVDYRKKKDVRWLCFKHHREEHGQKII